MADASVMKRRLGAALTRVGRGPVGFAIRFLQGCLDPTLSHLRVDFVCPAIGRAVEIVVVKERVTGRYLGVHSCSSFEPGERVRCRQGCLEALNAIASAGRFPRTLD